MRFEIAMREVLVITSSLGIIIYVLGLFNDIMVFTSFMCNVNKDAFFMIFQEIGQVLLLSLMLVEFSKLNMQSFALMSVLAYQLQNVFLVPSIGQLQIVSKRIMLLKRIQL